MSDAKPNDWIIYDKSMGMIAMHGPTKAAVLKAWAEAPAILRPDLVIFAPGWKHDSEGRVVGTVVDGPGWWCCRADYGEHEPTCENYVPPSTSSERAHAGRGGEDGE